MSKDLVLSLAGWFLSGLSAVFLLIDGAIGSWLFVGAITLFVICGATAWSQYVRARHPRPIELSDSQRTHVLNLKAEDAVAAVKQVRRYDRRATVLEAKNYVDGL
ncbi:hypothetical protein CCICO_02835 [Corynebacterium ciconiae DSM 44920]|uniref:hypothetical protein n=1 Tax=Corynebacterium ciconiae TaxID=227319 RepID=UPI00037C2DF6|nr:hypothetical protein [Corynebacterium ciconiae]WKD60612.1 hypothetical protein CCICO_02835 [Corynebacterium ciconiae DSM 44920]